MSDTLGTEVERGRMIAQKVLDTALELLNEDPGLAVEVVAPLSVASVFAAFLACHQKGIPDLDGGEHKGTDRVAAFLMDQWLDLADSFELGDLERWESERASA